MTPKQLEVREKALVRSREMEEEKAALAPIVPSELPKEERDKAAVALRAAGATFDQIAEALDISKSTVSAILNKEENKRIVQLVRETSKMEAITGGLVVQRRYMDAMAALPIDAKHAGAHAQLAKAFATIFDKAALAAGEATERTESRTIAITLDERRILWERLKEAQELRNEREIEAEYRIVGTP